MIRSPGVGDRIILFTLVDLLLQIIFLGLFLFAAHRAGQGDVDDRIAQLIRQYGVVRVGDYLNATSELVAIKDIGRVAVVPGGKPKVTQPLDEVTKLLQHLDRETLPRIAGMNNTELKHFTALVKKPDVRSLLAELAKLSPKDQRAFAGLGGAFFKADPDTRTKIIAAANVKPLCFARQNAYHITEVPGGYVVRPLIPDVLPDVARAVPGHRGMESFRLGEAEFARLGEVTLAAHRKCTVNVQQATTTNNERQFKTIQYYFGTW
ncbi:MAG: hypothetical protein JO036_11895 [Candidatus Eremiobacteraeota bacterium]|nr:hypothetical protein [Candidatus Eremiobacteraeota bacterium]